MPDGDETRFRWGISAFGGPIASGLHGGAGGIDARFGAQLSELLGVYAQPVILAGAGAAVSDSSASAAAFGLYGVGVLGDVTLSDLVYLAAGPEILLGGLAATSVSANSMGGTVSGSASAGAFFSVAARAGLAFGSMRPDRRKAFTIGLDVRVITNPGDAVIVPCLALGYESF